jgi:hypothetical protein
VCGCGARRCPGWRSPRSAVQRYRTRGQFRGPASGHARAEGRGVATLAASASVAGLSRTLDARVGKVGRQRTDRLASAVVLPAGAAPCACWPTGPGSPLSGAFFAATRAGLARVGEGAPAQPPAPRPRQRPPQARQRGGSGGWFGGSSRAQGRGVSSAALSDR